MKMKVFTGEDEINMLKNDNGYYSSYRFAWLILLVIGLIGLGIFSIYSMKLSFFIQLLNPTVLIPLATTIGGLFIICFFLAWIQVGIVAKIGKELILLVVYGTPFLLVGVSVAIYVQTQSVDYLGGVILGVLFFIVVIIFHKRIALSALLVEIGGEIVTGNVKMFVPAFMALVLKLFVTILWICGLFVLFPIFEIIAKVNDTAAAIVVIIAFGLFSFLYSFIIGVITSFAEAINLAIVHQWYTNAQTKPKLGDAKKRIADLRGPVTRYAFLMTFFGRFRNHRSRWTPFSMFKYMKMSSWPELAERLLFHRSPVGHVAHAASEVLHYLGTFTLVIIVSKKLNSVTQAYKESAKGVFGTFVTNIAGMVGLNIIETFRKWFSMLALIGLGAFYGYSIFSPLVSADSQMKLVWAIIFIFLFLLFGYIPLAALFRPVTIAYQYVLYQTYDDTKNNRALSKRLDKKSQDFIKEVFQKKKK